MTVRAYGLHPAQDVAIAAHELRHALRELSEETQGAPELKLAADLADTLADALDRHWWAVHPTLEVSS